MALRTKSREFAMQMLFQWDMSEQDPRRLETTFWKSAKAAAQTRSFANQLFEGAAHDAKQLDEIITKHAANWRLERISADRSRHSSPGDARDARHRYSGESGDQ